MATGAAFEGHRSRLYADPLRAAQRVVRLGSNSDSELGFGLRDSPGIFADSLYRCYRWSLLQAVCSAASAEEFSFYVVARNRWSIGCGMSRFAGRFDLGSYCRADDDSIHSAVHRRDSSSSKEPIHEGSFSDAVFSATCHCCIGGMVVHRSQQQDAAPVHWDRHVSFGGGRVSNAGKQKTGMAVSCT